MEIELSTNAYEKLKRIAEKRNISIDKAIEKAMHFYLMHKLKYAHHQKMYIVFDNYNTSFEQMIHELWKFDDLWRVIFS